MRTFAPNKSRNLSLHGTLHHVMIIPESALAGKGWHTPYSSSSHCAGAVSVMLQYAFCTGFMLVDSILESDK